MKNEKDKITIIPARFIEKMEDGRYLMRVLLDTVLEDRIFETYSLENIVNPKYIFIGISTGIGFMEIRYTDANEFESLFYRKWKKLMDIHVKKEK